jgi:hypothetical protein
VISITSNLSVPSEHCAHVPIYARALFRWNRTLALTLRTCHTFSAVGTVHWAEPNSGNAAMALQCPLCRSSFNGEQNRPVVIPCGHTVCASCMEQRFNSQQTTKYPAAGGHACCPQCQLPLVTKEGTALTLQQLPTNLLVLELIRDPRFAPGPGADPKVPVVGSLQQRSRGGMRNRTACLATKLPEARSAVSVVDPADTSVLAWCACRSTAHLLQHHHPLHLWRSSRNCRRLALRVSTLHPPDQERPESMLTTAAWQQAWWPRGCQRLRHSNVQHLWARPPCRASSVEDAEWLGAVRLATCITGRSLQTHDSLDRISAPNGAAA